MCAHGQLYGADPLYQPFDARATAPFAAIALQLLAVGLVVAWMPTRSWELLTSPVPTAIVLRWVLPTSVLVLVAVGYPALRASQAGLLDPETEVALIVVGSGFVLTVLLVWVTHSSVQESLRQAQRITRQLLSANRDTMPQPGGASTSVASR